MKKLVLTVAALTLAAGAAAQAQTYNRPQPYNPDYNSSQDYRNTQPDRRDQYDRPQPDRNQYDRDQYGRNQYDRNRYDNDRRDDGDREERWRQRYARDYRPQDDRAYQECRNQPDPAGVFAGAILGGILGNAVGGRAPGTVAGVVAGGAIGAALTSKMDCRDRSYAYKTYSQGFEAGRANAHYQWNDPQTGNRGDLHVLDYYRDEDGFRCAVFAHTVYMHGRPEEARGRACKQPNGQWAIID